ncbi:ABC transporter ATP-binding protein [candidate division KSB1 bacterium]|nr:ABC transporter ATP-binding protein [candidate division KSB1 bacterium]
MTHAPATLVPDERHGSLEGIAVRARHLTRSFGKFVAVDAINLDVRQGEIFGFLGANGAGKTTAIRMLCGLLLPSAGEGWVDGLAISSQTNQIKRRIGYMSQKFSLYADLTVAENLTFYGGIYGLTMPEIRERSAALYARLGLESQRNMLTGSLPLGYKQRLALGCATLHRPRIVFLDEPTGGVDPVARREFWNLIYELADAGSTIFVTTHYMDEAEYCGRVSIMDRGKIIALDAPRELKRQLGADSMQQVFLALVEPSARSDS